MSDQGEGTNQSERSPDGESHCENDLPVDVDMDESPEQPNDEA